MRRRFAVAFTLVTGIALLGACSASESESVAGKQWQIFEIYDDPELPVGSPEGTVPPIFTVGGRSYTATTACEVFQGTAAWHDDIVVLGAAQTVRTTNCDEQAQVFSDRFKRAVDGEFLYDIGRNGLRMTEIGDYPPGATAPGWFAVPSQ